MDTDIEQTEAKRLEQLEEATEQGEDGWSIIVYF